MRRQRASLRNALTLARVVQRSLLVHAVGTGQQKDAVMPNAGSTPLFSTRRRSLFGIPGVIGIPGIPGIPGLPGVVVLIGCVSAQIQAQTPSPTQTQTQTPSKLTTPTLSSTSSNNNNVFPAGSFDQLDARGWPIDWSKPVQGESVLVRQDAQGDRFIELLSAKIDPHQPRPVQITASLPLETGWRFMQFSAKLLVAEPQTDPSLGPRVTIHWLDAARKPVGQSLDLTPTGKANQWVVASTAVTEVPVEAAFVTFTPTLPAQGNLCVNDLRAIANPEFQPLTPGFPQGGFEKLDAAKQPLGWDIPPASRRVMLLEEDGNHYLRVVTDKQSAKSEHSVIYRLDPRWTQLTITARLRSPAPGSSVGNSTANPKNLPKNRLEISLLGKDRRPLPDSTRALWPAPTNNDWQRLTLPINVPPTGVYLRVTAIVTAPSSALDIDDVQIERTPPPE